MSSEASVRESTLQPDIIGKMMIRVINTMDAICSIQLCYKLVLGCGDDSVLKVLASCAG